MKIIITNEMRSAALLESKKRQPFISHHFNVSHFSNEESDLVGFLGEFCFCSLLGVNWKNNIRSDYLTIDQGDLNINNFIIDTKTETVPKFFADKIINKTIDDDKTYGRRLIAKSQVPLLEKYQIIVFGLFIRESLDAWYPIGWIFTSELKKYEPTSYSPTGKRYPFPGLPIKTSELKPISELIHLLKK